MNNKIGRYTQNSKFTYGHNFFSIILSIHIRNDLHAFKINSSEILFHSSLIAVLSESIFRWEDAFDLFSKILYIA